VTISTACGRKSWDILGTEYGYYVEEVLLKLYNQQSIFHIHSLPLSACSKTEQDSMTTICIIAELYKVQVYARISYFILNHFMASRAMQQQC